MEAQQFDRMRHEPFRSRLQRPLVERLIAEELVRVREEVGAARFDRGRFEEARTLFAEVATSSELQDFLTVPAYDALETR